MSATKRFYFPEIYKELPIIPESTEQSVSSNCCGSCPVGEVIDGLGICYACYEWAEFEEDV